MKAFWSKVALFVLVLGVVLGIASLLAMPVFAVGGEEGVSPEASLQNGCTPGMCPPDDAYLLGKGGSPPTHMVHPGFVPFLNRNWLDFSYFDICVNGDAHKAYCIQLGVAQDEGACHTLGDYLSDGRVVWILQNYYPHVPTKPSGLTDSEKASAVQLAIWHFVDGLNIEPDPIESPPAVWQAARQIRDLALGHTEVPGHPTLTLEPADATNPTGTEHTVTATLLDAAGAPVVGEEIAFEVSGANPGVGIGTTDANGQATFTYTGNNAGGDSITAKVNYLMPAGMRWNPPGGSGQDLIMAEERVFTLERTAHKEWTDSFLQLDLTIHGCEPENVVYKAAVRRKTVGGWTPWFEQGMIQMSPTEWRAIFTGLWPDWRYQWVIAAFYGSDIVTLCSGDETIPPGQTYRTCDYNYDYPCGYLVELDPSSTCSTWKYQVTRSGDSWVKSLSHFTLDLGDCIPEGELLSTSPADGENGWTVEIGASGGYLNYIKWEAPGGGWEFPPSMTFEFTLDGCYGTAMQTYEVKWGSPSNPDSPGCLVFCDIMGPDCEEQNVDKTWLLDIGGCEPAGVEYLGVLRQGGQVIKSIPLLPGQTATMHNVQPGTYQALFVYKLPGGDWQVLDDCIVEEEEIGPGKPNENFCTFTWPCDKTWKLTVDGCEPDGVKYRGVLYQVGVKKYEIVLVPGQTATMQDVQPGTYQATFEYSTNGGQTWTKLDECSKEEEIGPGKPNENFCSFTWPCDKEWLLTITGVCEPAGVQYRGVLYQGGVAKYEIALTPGQTATMQDVQPGTYQATFEYSLDGGGSWKKLDACSKEEKIGLENPHPRNTCTYEWPCYHKKWQLYVKGCKPANRATSKSLDAK